jgi:dehydrodolichyl diphosphate syntase complex subunit NUS1
MYKIIAGFILYIIHLTYWLKSLTVLWVRRLGGAFHHRGTCGELILRDAKRLKKLPFHLAIILSERNIIYEDVARLANWSFMSGIQYVSVYDHRGEVKSNIDILTDCVMKGIDDSNNVHVIATSSSNIPTLSSGSYLIVLSREDGYNALVDVAQSLCHDNSSITVDPSIIDNVITFPKGLPEPDLAVICGSTHSLLGYPCWPSHLTEIMWLSGHRQCTFSEFHHLLQRYANSQQRHGK